MYPSGRQLQFTVWSNLLWMLSKMWCIFYILKEEAKVSYLWREGKNICPTLSANQTLKKCAWTNIPSFKLLWRVNFKLLRGFRYSSNSPSDIWLLLLIINNNHPIFLYTFRHEFRISKLIFSSASDFFNTPQTRDFSSLLTCLGFTTAWGWHPTSLPVHGVSICWTRPTQGPRSWIFTDNTWIWGFLALFLARVQPEAHSFALAILEPGCGSNESRIIKMKSSYRLHEILMCIFSKVRCSKR